MQYRPEIDGLRAVAVLPVIFFHAGMSGFSGGFVGVDVFFVISGYLITTIILAARNKDNFSLVDFYERRARRILPALFLVMACSFILAWQVLTPFHMRDFSQSVVAVLAFASNFLFWQESGYFGTANELKPLLHTWSLAVEEQFYVLFPLLLAVVWPLGKRAVLLSLLLVVAGSLTLSQLDTTARPVAGFFLLHSRAWELALGALAAFYLFYRGTAPGVPHERPWTRELLAAAGLVSIILAIVLYNHRTRFPGIAALLPTVGTCLVILFANGQTLTGKLLGSRALVAIGLISYSAYLWHQPLFAFSRHKFGHSVDSWSYLGLTLLSLILAWLSWKLVETPFRDRQRISRGKLIVSIVVVAGALGALGLYGHFNKGYPNRFSPAQLQVLDAMDYDYKALYRSGECFLDGHVKLSDLSQLHDQCGKQADLVLWGDSYAAALFHGFEQKADNVGTFAGASCPPLVSYFTRATHPRCQDFNDQVALYLENAQPATLVLSANWMIYLKMYPELVHEKFRHTIEYLRRITPQTRIVILGTTPQWESGLPMMLFRKQITLEEQAYVASKRLPSLRAEDARIAQLAKEYDLQFISLHEQFCRQDGCLSSAGENGAYEPMVWDSGHLTRTASGMVARYVFSQLESSPAGTSGTADQTSPD